MGDRSKPLEFEIRDEDWNTTPGDNPDYHGWEGRPNGNDQTKSNRLRFKLEHFADIHASTDVPYLIQDIIPRKGLVLLWGPPKCGKTFYALDMVMHIAIGRTFRQRRVKQGAVVYCSFEGGIGVDRRVDAFKQNLLDGVDARNVPFWLIKTSISLAKDQKALVASIRAQIGDVIPSVVTLDTLNRSIGGSESKDEDMGAYIQAADAIAEAFGCAVIVVHHCGIEDGRPRGHTSLTGAADTQLACRMNNGIAEVEVEYMKDGEAGAILPFKLKQVEVAVDIEGVPITSCIVDPIDDTPRKAAQPGKKTKLPGGAQVALGALHEALLKDGYLPTFNAHIPDHTKVVTIEQWRRQAYARGIATGDKPEAQKKAFQRAMTALQAAKAIGVWQETVWSTGTH